MKRIIERKGIDVSRHQGNIIWSDVKADGVEFAIIRAGYGRTAIDEQFYSNINGCIENGIDIGIYWFIYGINEQEAIENADMCHSAIAQYKDNIKMKVWCDLEYDTDKIAINRGVTLTKQKRSNMIIAFCERLKKYGYDVGYYANPDYLNNKLLDLSSYYPLWLAKYASSKGNIECFMWQHSSTGSVKGIKGNVDMDIHYETVSDTVLEKIEIRKGDLNQFSQIICNIKEALNVDFGLKFVINNSVDDVLLINLGNVNLSLSVHTVNLTYALTQLLAWWGYPITPTTAYDNVVSATISLFQTQTGLAVTGSTTAETWRKLLGK